MNKADDENGDDEGHELEANLTKLNTNEKIASTTNIRTVIDKNKEEDDLKSLRRHKPDVATSSASSKICVGDR